jgi:hypothetical protein
MLCAMQMPRRTQRYLIQLRVDGTPGLTGRVQPLGEPSAISFTSARELVEVLRQLVLAASDRNRDAASPTQEEE